MIGHRQLQIRITHGNRSYTAHHFRKFTINVGLTFKHVFRLDRQTIHTGHSRQLDKSQTVFCRKNIRPVAPVKIRIVIIARRFSLIKHFQRHSFQVTINLFTFYRKTDIRENIVHLLGNPAHQQLFVSFVILHGQIITIRITLQQRQCPIIITQGISYLRFFLQPLCFLRKIQQLHLSTIENPLDFTLLDISHHGSIRLVLNDDTLRIGQSRMRIRVDNRLKLIFGCSHIILRTALSHLLELCRDIGRNLADQ